MNIQGLALCTRFSYPPNSLSLCGPEKQNDLAWYTATLQTDLGTKDILSQFETLYPYLSLIAYENNIQDPFDARVVEAYWIGNRLLSTISMYPFVKHLSDKLELKKKMKRSQLERVFVKIEKGGFPHHSFHVLNIYKTTGNADILHMVQTMDACIINWGKVVRIEKNKVTVITKPLTFLINKIGFGQTRERTLLAQGKGDELIKKIQINDWISYHWGYFCQKLNPAQLRNLIYYTKRSIGFANFSV